MTKFFIKYIIVAAIGSAAIYVGVPYLSKSTNREKIKKSALDITETIETKVTEVVEEVVEEVKQAQEPDAPEPKKINYFDIAKKQIEDKHWDAAIQTCDTALKEQPNNKYYLDLRKKAVARGCKWGVVIQHGANAYKIADGKFKLASKIEAGTILEVTGTKTAGGKEYSCCLVLYKQREIPNVYILAKYLELKPGMLKKASVRQRDLMKQIGQLHGRITIAKSKLLAAKTKSSSIYKDYKKAKSKYDIYWAKVKDLQKKRDNATAGTHEEYGDQLRMMKGQDIQIGTDYKAAKSSYIKWKAEVSHQIAIDPRLQKLNNELANLKQELQSI